MSNYFKNTNIRRNFLNGKHTSPIIRANSIMMKGENMASSGDSAWLLLFNPPLS